MDYLLISSVYILLETFFLISLRMIGFFLVVPIFGGQSIPNAAKISIAMATSFILLTTNSIAPYPLENASIILFFAVGIKEAAVGLIMGFTIYFLVAMFYYVGQLVDFQIGFSMISVFDPMNQIQIPISGNLFYLTVTFLLVLTGAHYNFFRALFYSYQVIPIGEAVLTGESLVYTGVGLFGTFFEFGLQTALPVVGTMLVLEIALGILNKASPQMHIFSIGMQLKIFVGLFIVLMVLPVFSNISEKVFLEINKALYSIIKGMTAQ